MLRPGLLILVIFLTPSDPPKEDATTKDKERLQGKWNCETIESHGINLVGQDFQETKFDLDFKPDKVIVRSKDKTDSWSYKLDAMSNPKSIDLTYLESGKSVTAKGIYMIDGDTFVICWSIPEDARPKEFKSKPKSSHAVIVFRRDRN